MAGKARVHELAKELGVTSKEVLARLSDQGEFVKSASSTVEAPVARRLRESFGGAKPAADKVKADGNGSPQAGRESTREAGGAQACCARGAGRTGATARCRRGLHRRHRRHRPHPRPPGPDSGRDTRSPARSGTRCAQARRAGAARRQQSILFPAAGRSADSASAGTPSGCPAARAPRPACRRAICLSVRPEPGRVPVAAVVREDLALVPAAVVVVPAQAQAPVAARAVAAVTTAPVAPAVAAAVHPQAAAIAVVPAAGVVPASVAVPRVRSVVPAVRPSVDVSRSGRNAPNTRTCRRPSSVACGCRTATAKRSGSRAVRH